MAYKEPNNKAKLAKLKEDILGDGVKESKLDAYVSLKGSEHAIGSDLAKSILLNRSPNFKVSEGDDLIDLYDSPDDLLAGAFFAINPNTNFSLAGVSTKGGSTSYPYYSYGYIICMGGAGSIFTFNPYAYVSGAPTIDSVKYKINSVFTIVKATVKVDLYKQDNHVIGPYISEINIEPVIY